MASTLNTHACTVINLCARPCEQYLSACCVIVIVYIPVGYQLVDSLHLKSSKKYSWSDTCCDIRSYTVLECPKIPSRSFCVLLPKLEELNSWILRLGKAGLVVTKIGVRCLLCMRNKSRRPSFDSFVRILIFSDGAYLRYRSHMFRLLQLFFRLQASRTMSYLLV